MRRLIVSCGNAIITFENENTQKLLNFADFCKSIGAHSSTGDPFELVIDYPTESVIEKLHSLAFELGLF